MIKDGEYVLKPEAYKDWEVKPRGGIVDLIKNVDNILCVFPIIKPNDIDKIITYKDSFNHIKESDILGPYIDYGEEVEFSRDGKEWVLTNFSQYDISLYTLQGDVWFEDTRGDTWSYIRKPEKKMYPLQLGEYEGDVDGDITMITEEQKKQIVKMLESK